MNNKHYENFPVASWLCPAHLRAAIGAIYNFARCADDIADEGHALFNERFELLSCYKEDLEAIYKNKQLSSRWLEIFEPLSVIVNDFNLPKEQLARLLEAFEQDIVATHKASIVNPSYDSEEQLLQYCCYSANPIGRLLLHLYQINDSKSLEQSDAICSSLQLINFWQDLSVDIPRMRYYLPKQSVQRYGVNWQTVVQREDTLQSQQLIEHLCGRARRLLREGAPLVHTIPGRAGLELRLVVQGGMRILDKIATMQYRTLQVRPKLERLDYVKMLIKALMM